jgi:hypothetical protein
MRSFVLAVAVAVVACSARVHVGQICFISSDAGPPDQSVIGSPALECPSRTCLHVAAQTPDQPDLCTADCAKDDDCQADPSTRCATGFACAVPLIVGPFAGRKMCVCRDYEP